MSDQIWHAINGLWRRLGSNPVPPGQVSGKPLVGASIGANTQASWEAFEAQVGEVLIRRSFAGPGVYPATFAASNAGIDIGHRESIWSFKPVPSTFAAGGNDVWFNTFLDSIPAGHKTILALWHEPEEELLAGDFTLADWKAANNHMGQLVHAKNRPELRTTIIIMGPYDFNPSNPAYYTEFWDSGFDTNMDYIGFDPYNFNDASFLDTQQPFLDTIAWAQAKNKPMILPEFACVEDPGGDATKKATFIQHTYQYCSNLSMYAILYFNNSQNNPVALTTSPQAMAAFAAINADSKSS